VHIAQKTSAMRDVGADEMKKLRVTYLGWAPTQIEIANAIKRYLVRQYFRHWFYKAGILGY
jgi:hypothetical protein